ncbi:hypothetical protein AAVH_43276, partial [Aphelenchoides avenae]
HFLLAGTERAIPKRILVFYPLLIGGADPLTLPSTIELPHNTGTRTGSPPGPQFELEFKEDTVTVYAVRNEELGVILDIFVGTAKNRHDDGIYFFAIRQE